MIPGDGTGYGRSLYWEQQAKQIAKNKLEYCRCWDFINPIIHFSTDGTYKLFVACKSSSLTCTKDFQKTDKALTKKFKEFYK